MTQHLTNVCPNDKRLSFIKIPKLKIGSGDHNMRTKLFVRWSSKQIETQMMLNI